MKLAFFIPYFEAGGVTRSTLPLAKQFVDHGHEVDLVTVRVIGQADKLLPRGVKLVELGGRRTLFSVPKLISYLRRERPHALISAILHGNLSAVLARALSFTQTRLVITERIAISQGLGRESGAREHILRFLTKRLYGRADAVVTNSLDSSRDLEDFLDWERGTVTTVLNPTFNDSYQSLANASIDDPWFLGSQSAIILGIGRLTSQKDFHTLIKAFTVAQNEIDCRLVILGEGEEREDLEDLAERLSVGNGVRFLGQVKNPYAYLRRSSLFVLSSRYEGLPNALIEAHICGVPSISTDCVSGPREVQMDGAAGGLVPVGDHGRLGAEIIRFLRSQSLRDEVVKTATDNLNRFSPEKCYESYMDILAKL